MNVKAFAPFLAALIALLPPAAAVAGGIEGFDGWAEERCGEIDRQWERVSSSGRAAGWSGTMPAWSSDDHSRIRGRFEARGRTSGPGTPSWSGAASAGFFSSRDTGGRFLWRTSRKRGGPSRGLSTLESPAEARLGFTSNRRLPFNAAGKYTRSSGFGRTGRWRKSPSIGQRISSSRSRRTGASSLTRGATRVRRSARSTR